MIPHQANLRIIEAVAKKAGVPMERVYVNVHRYGNMSAATVPVALCEALEEGRVKPGALLLMPSFGGGLTFTGHVVRWGQRVTPLGTSDVDLPPNNQTALETSSVFARSPAGRNVRLNAGACDLVRGSRAGCSFSHRELARDDRKLITAVERQPETTDPGDARKNFGKTRLTGAARRPRPQFGDRGHRAVGLYARTDERVFRPHRHSARAAGPERCMSRGRRSSANRAQAWPALEIAAQLNEVAWQSPWRERWKAFASGNGIPTEPYGEKIIAAERESPSNNANCGRLSVCGLGVCRPFESGTVRPRF